MKDTCSVLESAAEQSEIFSTMQKRCLCRHFVRIFHNALFMWFVPHFTLVVTRLSLSSLVSLLVID